MRPACIRSMGRLLPALLLILLTLTAGHALAEAVCDGEALRVFVSVANQWESDGRFFYQYDVTAENRTAQPVEDWSARIPSEACEVSQCWNCGAEFADGAILVKPLGYARRVEPGQSVTGIGMIVAYPAAQALPASVPAMAGMSAQAGTAESAASGEQPSAQVGAEETGTPGGGSSAQPGADGAERKTPEGQLSGTAESAASGEQPSAQVGAEETGTPGGRSSAQPGADGVERETPEGQLSGTAGSAASGEQPPAQMGAGETGTPEGISSAQVGAESAESVAPEGRLSVSGGRLVNAEGQPVALRGVSTHGIGWFPEYVNADAFRTLRDDYGVNAIRIALYTEEYNGYCAGGDRQQLKRLVEQGVGFATELGMYVIIDWHTLSDGDPNRHADEAVAFWREMAQAYAGQDNVLYEICNEPNGQTTWEAVRAYAEQIIPVIREFDGEAVILVGTPNWCQQLDGPMKNPVDDGNVMYTLHFYAATHGQALRDELERALSAGLPVFISECSICEASGSGRVDYASADAWRELIRRHGLSCVAWNLSNKDEAAALIRSDCAKQSGWTEAELSETGKWFLMPER